MIPGNNVSKGKNVDAIILAGMQTIKYLLDSENKALLDINGKMMIEYVIDAVRNSDDIKRVLVVGPTDLLKERLKGYADVIDAGGTVMENLMAGIRHLGCDSGILVLTSDIPLLTTEAVNDFVCRSKETKADFCYPVIDKRISQSKYPEMERTYVKIKEGFFTGGNIFYINPGVLKERIDIAQRLYKARKNPMKMAGILGFGFLLRLLLGILTIDKAEKVFSKIMNIQARVIISEYPEIGNDVDKPIDVMVVTAYLSK